MEEPACNELWIINVCSSHINKSFAFTIQPFSKLEQHRGCPGHNNSIYKCTDIGSQFNMCDIRAVYILLGLKGGLIPSIFLLQLSMATYNRKLWCVESDRKVISREHWVVFGQIWGGGGGGGPQSESQTLSLLWCGDTGSHQHPLSDHATGDRAH